MVDSRTQETYKKLGRRVAQIRADRELTQREVADRTAGRLSRTAIANIESGRQRVAIHHLYDISDALGVRPVDLLPDPNDLPPILGRSAQTLSTRVAQRGEGTLLPRSKPVGEK